MAWRVRLPGMTGYDDHAAAYETTTPRQPTEDLVMALLRHHPDAETPPANTRHLKPFVAADVKVERPPAEHLPPSTEMELWAAVTSAPLRLPTPPDAAVPAVLRSADVQRELVIRGVSWDQVRSYDRSRPIVAARYAVMAILRENGLSLGQIGRTMQRDHTTVIHGIRRAKEISQ